MQQLIDTLQGRKTYILAFIAAAYHLALAFGWISSAHQVEIEGLLASGFAATFRAALGKL